jgi:hypothetical protein
VEVSVDTRDEGNGGLATEGVFGAAPSKERSGMLVGRL